MLRVDSVCGRTPLLANQTRRLALGHLLASTDVVVDAEDEADADAEAEPKSAFIIASCMRVFS
jgi:hypothetical protein